MDCAPKIRLSSYFSFATVFNPEHTTTLVGRHFWPLVIAFDDKKFRLPSENLDDLWPEDAGFGSRRYKA